MDTLLREDRVRSRQNFPQFKAIGHRTDCPEGGGGNVDLSALGLCDTTLEFAEESTVRRQ